MRAKNWALEAASDIVKHVDYFKEITTATVQGYIEKHCPMKPDVAYMPVPRCETCKWWKQLPGYPDGICEMAADSDAPMASEFDDLVITSKNFGCVQHEQKVVE